MDLREARFQKRRTQYDLWRLTGINAPRLSLAERGFVKLKKSEREAVAAALGVPVESIDFDKDPEAGHCRREKDCLTCGT